MKKAIINIEEVLNFYKNHTINQCAKHFKTSTRNILEIIKNSGYKKEYENEIYKKHKLEIKNLYEKNKTAKEISIILNIKIEKVYRIFKVLNINYKYDLKLKAERNKKELNNLKLKEKEEKQKNEIKIIELYQNNKSIYNISKQFNISIKKVLRILKCNNIKIRNKEQADKNRTFNCTHNYFETIDTSDKAYFLGWMISDGWIRKNGIGISVNSKDSYILKLFKQYINYLGNINSYELKTGKTMNSISITSLKIKNDLFKYGVIPNKTHFTYFPDIPEEFHSHFIRGVFDGDGCIHIDKFNNLSFSIIGNIDLIEKIQEVLIKQCDLRKTKLKLHNKKHFNIVYLSYGGNRQCKKIYEWLYKDCDDLYLKRKKEKFEIYGKK